MKIVLPVLSSVMLVWGLMGFVAFAEDSPVEKSAKAPAVKEAPKIPAWNVRVEMLMVAMPQEKALALLPDLRAPEKIETAMVAVFTALEHKEALLMGYPEVITVDGQRGTSETILEKRYPTEFNPPVEPLDVPLRNRKRMRFPPLLKHASVAKCLRLSPRCIRAGIGLTFS